MAAVLNSFADVIRDWGGLLEAVGKYPELLATTEPERQILTESLDTVQDLKAQQDELRARRQDVTSRMNVVVNRGKDAAAQIRSLAKGRLGLKSELLVHFQVAPVRPRRGRSKARKGKTNPQVETAPAAPAGEPSAT